MENKIATSVLENPSEKTICDTVPGRYYLSAPTGSTCPGQPKGGGAKGITEFLSLLTLHGPTKSETQYPAQATILIMKSRQLSLTCRFYAFQAQVLAPPARLLVSSVTLPFALAFLYDRTGEVRAKIEQ